MLGTNARNRLLVKISLGQLAFQFGCSCTGFGCVVTIEADVTMPVAPVSQNNVPGFYSHVVVIIEEPIIRKFKNRTERSACSVGKVKIAMLVVPAEGFNPKRFAIDPPKARNVILAGMNGELHPHGLAAQRSHHTDADLGIGIAWLRITLEVHIRSEE